MLDRDSWINSTGRIYRTRNGQAAQIVVVGQWVWGRIIGEKPANAVAWDFDGHHIDDVEVDHGFDLVKLERTGGSRRGVTTKDLMQLDRSTNQDGQMNESPGAKDRWSGRPNQGEPCK